MTDQLLLLSALSSAVSVLTAALAVAALARIRRPALVPADHEARAVFLMECGRVVDASEAGRQALDLIGSDPRCAEDLVTWLSDPFPDLPAAIPTLDTEPMRRLTARDGVARLDLERDGDRVRLTLCDEPTERVVLDRTLHGATAAELDALRGISEAMPYPCWRQDAAGRINWVNRAYLDLLRETTGERPAFPPQPVFDGLVITRGEAVRAEIGNRCYECTATASGESGVLITALPVDALVRAEESLDAFKQTMSRTFAHLTVGLAIFDRWRRLAVFNPALTDLTALPIDILLSRPTLESFLDILRARQLMPEPRDYSSWREKVLDVERGAQTGTYSELWHLADGRTYRITGRPQPDGAFALLMEDISGEIGLTRRFRSEIETGRAILDALPDALAVFDDAGNLTMTNAAYDRLWNIDTIDGVTQLGLRDAGRAWRTICEPGPAWDSIMVEREGTHELRHCDGRRIAMTCSGLHGGARLVRFRVAEAEVSALMPAQARDRIAARLKA